MLETILANKRLEVAALRAQSSIESFNKVIANLPPTRNLRAAIRGTSGTAIIAEIKRQSPSGGILKANLDPRETAVRYRSAGASALSVLTDEKFFGGSLDDLCRVRQAVDLPILRKDFIIDDLQVLQSRAAGADAVLLIVAALDRNMLSALFRIATETGLEALVEVHTEAEAGLAVDIGAELIGINNRDLHTFEIDLSVTARLAPLLPKNVTIVSESGMSSARDIAFARQSGAHAVLVGHHLMTSDDPAASLQALMESRP